MHNVCSWIKRIRKLFHCFTNYYTTHSAIETVHALWALQGFNAIDDTTIRKALHYPVAGVRENAIQIAELYLQKMPQLENDLFQLQNDAAAKCDISYCVRLEVLMIDRQKWRNKNY
jgi:hypothetical protein